MKIRTLLAAILGLVLTSSLSLSQEAASSEPVLEETLSAEPSSPEPSPNEPISQGPYAMETSNRRGSSRARSSSGEMIMRIFVLKYYPVEELENLIENIFGIDRDKI